MTTTTVRETTRPQTAQPGGGQASSPATGTPQPGSQEYADLARTGQAPPLPVEPTAPSLSDPATEPIDAAGTSAAGLPDQRGHDRTRLPGLPSNLGLRKFRDRLQLPPVIRPRDRRGAEQVTVRAQLTMTRLHADLPPTQVWAYEGSVPGPTIEVERGQEVHITWANELTRDDGAAHLPYDVVRVPPRPATGGPINADFARALQPGGRSTSRGVGEDSYPPLAHTEALTAATVVHLHGSLTNGHNDGWAHNVAQPGEVTRCAYPNRQEATTLWYHDHAMAVTRFTVHAGLAGFYLIRDEQERSLGLPCGDYELPVMIADRNLETAAPAAPGQPARFTGRVLYKQAGFDRGPGSIAGEIPMTGPYTLVNGRIWPSAELEPRWYRLRLLNASNSRVLTLALHDTTDEEPGVGTDISEGRRIADGLTVIGTDGGLLPAPHRTSTLVMGPGERTDVLIDLRPHAGRTLELRNEVGTRINAAPGQADASVMQILVGRRARGGQTWEPPARLSSAYRRYEHTADGRIIVGDRVIDSHEHTWIGVVPPGVRGSAHPEIWELGPVPEGQPLPTSDLVQITRRDGSVLSLHPVAKLFDDAVTIRFAEGDWAVWNLVHLGGPDHPIHIHMTEFQMLSRSAWPVTGGAVTGFDLATGSTTTPLPVPAPLPLSPIDEGMKDTWVLRAGQWVQVLGEFRGAQGSFMYHCHILDHEDHTMMRPFVVLPPSLLAFHGGHGGHH